MSATARGASAETSPAGRRVLLRVLVIAAVAWPLLLAAAVWARQSGVMAGWADVLYAGAARICHQRPDRSFVTAGVQWPVCGRCAGLYLAAPFGALFAIWRRWAPDLRAVLAIAAVPTAITLGLEWLHAAPVSNVVRAAAALPLGAAIAWVLVRVN